MKTTVAEIAELVGGKLLRGESGAELSNFAALDQADAGCVSFFGNPKYAEQLATTNAGLVLVPLKKSKPRNLLALVLVENPVLAFDRIIKEFGVEPPAFEAGVHEAAVGRSVR
jgi:UDP-3-O-[3-hydroxymyristoyl] glucosamine N-acyltransferase